MYLRHLGDLCSSAAYINFLMPFRAAYNIKGGEQWSKYGNCKKLE